MRHEFPHRRRRHRRVNHDDRIAARDGGDRREVLERVERQPLVEMGIAGDDAEKREEQRMPVAWRPGDLGCADIAGGARPVLHDDGPPRAPDSLSERSRPIRSSGPPAVNGLTSRTGFDG